jgi:hypothetical protein
MVSITMGDDVEENCFLEADTLFPLFSPLFLAYYQHQQEKLQREGLGMHYIPLFASFNFIPLHVDTMIDE